MASRNQSISDCSNCWLGCCYCCNCHIGCNWKSYKFYMHRIGLLNWRHQFQSCYSGLLWLCSTYRCMRWLGILCQCYLCNRVWGSTMWIWSNNCFSTNKYDFLQNSKKMRYENMKTHQVIVVIILLALKIFHDSIVHFIPIPILLFILLHLLGIRHNKGSNVLFVRS